MTLRKKLIRLAYSKRELREHILPLIIKSARNSIIEMLRGCAPKGWKVLKEIESDNVVLFKGKVHNEDYVLRVFYEDDVIVLDLFDPNGGYVIDRDLPYLKDVARKGESRVQKEAQKIFLQALSEIKSPLDKLREVYEIVKKEYGGGARISILRHPINKQGYISVVFSDDLDGLSDRELRALEKEHTNLAYKKLKNSPHKVLVSVDTFVDENYDGDYGDHHISIEIRLG